VTATIAIAILAIAALALIVILVVNANRGRRRVEDLPPGMRPAYSDEELETTVLERYMAWGTILFLGLAVFFPLYLLYEGTRLRAAEELFLVENIVRGEEEYEQLCALCHGPEGVGGAAPVRGREGESWPAPALNDIVVRYADNPLIDVGRRQTLEDFIRTTIERGRPGTPMPAWGAAFEGPLTDQEIQQMVDWIIAIQVDPDDEEVVQADPATGVSGAELYEQNCMKCHAADLEGDVGPPLIGLFERHSDDVVLEILRNGIKVPTGAIMPPWQNGYMYPDRRFDDSALRRIIAYIREQQPPDSEPHRGTIGRRPGAEPPPEPEPADDGDAVDA
jgi:mono/diheme cytochrome c family protein